MQHGLWTAIDLMNGMSYISTSHDVYDVTTYVRYMFALYLITHLQHSWLASNTSFNDVLPNQNLEVFFL